MPKLFTGLNKTHSEFISLLAGMLVAITSYNKEFNMLTIAYGSNELVNQYQHLSSGHFFDKDTMRFFNSRVTSNYRRLDDYTALFITTEKDSSGVRRATIRRAKLNRFIRESDGRECHKIEIDSVSDFNALSLAQAKKTMERI